ncbi:MAG: hypothetical protein QOC89_4933 [Paraburkholderia sp.]|nr:hypothetical protein [Paraburkholderia sp.]
MERSGLFEEGQRNRDWGASLGTVALHRRYMMGNRRIASKCSGVVEHTAVRVADSRAWCIDVGIARRTR